MGSGNPHTVDSDMTGIFDDATFNSLQYDYSSADSPFDASRYFNLNSADNADSPDFNIATSSKPAHAGDVNAAHTQTQTVNSRSLVSSRSAESSSQDSSSESSVRNKRKTTSESPPTENMAGLKVENAGTLGNNLSMATGNYNGYQNFGTSMNNLSLDQDFMGGSTAMNTHFDFDSAASSPGGLGSDPDGYSTQTPMNASGVPADTIEPAHFFLGSSATSPTSIKGSGTADQSPAAMFQNNTPSSGAPDMFSNNQMWGAATMQNPAWSNDYSNAFASPGALGLTPSPIPNESAQYSATSVPVEEDRIPLHIGPIPAKSRVETQINIRMTIDRLPTGVKNVHLPTHTIAKAKLLSKDIVPSEDTLELHTMLVCTSAMQQPHLRQKAMDKAGQQDNVEIQARGVAGGVKKEEKEEENEEDKPANGGEVRICQNCINRERKRAARKKLKKEEEQAHWERYETERVIVFNTNEFKPWQEWQQSPPPRDSSMPGASADSYPPSETAMQVTAPMRIACYCRHQNEKDGFQVIFTLKDYKGKVVAQQISDSILITDDHKTHPLASMPGHVWYDGQFAPPPGFGASQSMIDLPSQMASMPISKSTGNLQAMGFAATQPFHVSSSMHQMPNFASQPVSGTTTPRNLSRPASPTGFGQAGPSKKRKSSSAHRRMPSGLAMTRVDTSQPNMQNTPSAVSNHTPFSPTSGGTFTPTGDGSYISLPHAGSRAQYHTQPPTPSEGTSFPYGALQRQPSLDNANFGAFYSAPSSAHQSRAASPVLQGPNLAAFQRQQSHGQNMPIRTNPFALQSPPTSAPHHQQQPQQQQHEPDRPHPIINKVTPSDGPVSGGIEVSIYGQGFTPGMDVMFGDRIATATTYWGEKALCCVLPPGQVGPVPVAIAPSHGRQFPSSGPAQAFRYTSENNDMRMMEMALRFYAMKMTGHAENWQSTAQDAANMWINTANSGPSMPGAYPGS